MIAQLRPALVMIALFTLLTGIVVPLGFVGAAHALFPSQADGSLVTFGGKVVGSSLIGQAFTSDKYFHGRPSALMGADPKDASKQVATPYDASESGASNLAPASKALQDRVKADVAALGATDVPGDMVTSSASGLDPDISPQNAALQVARVAKARGLAEDAVRTVLAEHIQAPALGFIGSARVNVLAVNMALDGAQR